MYDGGYDSRNPFQYDGEGKDPCTGYGCDCDEKITEVFIIIKDLVILERAVKFSLFS